MMTPRLDPIMPFEFSAGDPEEMVAAMLRIRRDYGIRRFAFTGPGIGVRIAGYPSDDAYREIAADILLAREAARNDGIEIGWWCAPTLKAGNSPYQHLVDIGGGASPISSCPLDPGFAGDLARRVALVAEIARPFMILFEDDFQLSNHPGFVLGCACPLHLARFALLAGREYSREELQTAFSDPERFNPELRRLWAGMARETMTGLAGRIRAAVDRVAPKTRLCLCQPGGADWDGDLTGAVARAFAGPDTRPAVRIFGAQYSSPDAGRAIPGVLGHTLYSARHLPADFELFHETDTYPHTRWFASAAFVESLLCGALAAGAGDTLFYASQYLDDPAEETGYLAMYRRNAARLNAFRAVLDGCEPAGCRILYRPEAGWRRPLSERWRADGAIGEVAGALGRLGVPCAVRGAGVAVLAGNHAWGYDDAELAEILSGAVLLDAEAARILYERGFGAWLGVAVGEFPPYAVSQECILPAAGVASEGKRMYNMAFAPAGGEAARYVGIRLAGAEALTEFRDPADRPVQPGLTRYVNAAGGRVAVMASEFHGNQSSNLFCYRKQAVLQALFRWLNGGAALAATAVGAPNLWPSFLVHSSGRTAVLMLVNLCSDPLENAAVELTPEWRAAAVEELGDAGRWRAIAPEPRPASVRLPGTCLPLRPRIFRLLRHD